MYCGTEQQEKVPILIQELLDVTRREEEDGRYGDHHHMREKEEIKEHS